MCKPLCLVENCTECTNNVNVCLTCYDKFFLSSGQCTACTENCAECSNTVTCDVCSPGATMR